MTHRLLGRLSHRGEHLNKTLEARPLRKPLPEVAPLSGWEKYVSNHVPSH